MAHTAGRVLVLCGVFVAAAASEPWSSWPPSRSQQLRGASPGGSAAAASPLEECPGHSLNITLVDVSSAAASIPDPEEQCFYPVRQGESVEENVTSYAWLPNSRLSGEAKEAAPHGVFIYRKTDGSTLYRATSHVLENEYPNVATLRMGQIYKLEFTTFEEIRTAARGIDCTSSPISFGTSCPEKAHELFAYVAFEDGQEGFVFQPRSHDQGVFLMPFMDAEKF
jgi:hypothetical protein